MAGSSSGMIVSGGYETAIERLHAWSTAPSSALHWADTTAERQGNGFATSTACDRRARNVSQCRRHRQSRKALWVLFAIGMASRHDTGPRSWRTEECGVVAIAPFCPLARRWPVRVTCICGATRACQGTSHASLRLSSLGITLLMPRMCPCWWLCQSPPNRYRQQRWEPR